MKKQFLYGTLALLGLAACSNDEFLGDVSTQNEGGGAIAFSSKAGKIQRGTAAAAKANDLEAYVDNFNVYGVKHTTSTETPTVVVFDQYKVLFGDDTGNTTASNTKDWEYVGVKDNQTIKYWDYSAPYYMYWATAPDEAAALTVTNGLVTKAEFADVTTADGDPSKVVFYADPLKVYQANYGKEVTPIFKRLQAKVRFGFYETIPGYAVSDVKFYARTSAGVAPSKGAGATDKFAAMVEGGTISTKSKYVITYDNEKLTSTLAATPSTNGADKAYNIAFGGLDYGDTKVATSTNSHINAGSSSALPALKESSATPTYAKNASYPTNTADVKVGQDPYYTAVLPTDATNAKAIKVMCDFVLTSTDKQEQIKVTGATAIIPADYTAWKSNYSYTYLFKISDQVNGTTGTVTGGNNDKVYPADPNGVTDPTNVDYGKDPAGHTPWIDGESGKVKNPEWGKDENGNIIPSMDKDGDGKIDEEWTKLQEDLKDGAVTPITPQDGLYAITFDAVVASNGEASLQGTITTVSEPSVTTYQEGSTNANGITYYNTKNPIDIEVVDGGKVAANLATTTLLVKKVTVDATTGKITASSDVSVSYSADQKKATFTPTLAEGETSAKYRVTYGANLDKTDGSKVIKVVKFIDVAKKPTE